MFDANEPAIEIQSNVFDFFYFTRLTKVNLSPLTITYDRKLPQNGPRTEGFKVDCYLLNCL